jgi:Tfp pilus assembly protein PilO
MPSNSKKKSGVASLRLTRGQAVAAVVVLALADLAFWALAVRPLGDREAEERAATASLAAQVAAREASVERLRAAVERMEGARDGGDELLRELTFARRTTFSELLTEIGKAAQEAGVEMRETNYESDTISGNERYGMVSISANFRGGYENLVRLLHRLDRAEKFLIVERLAAAPREDGLLAIALRFDAFVRDDGELAGGFE